MFSPAHVDEVINVALSLPTATNDDSFLVAVQKDRVNPFCPRCAHYSSFQGMPSLCQPGACVCVSGRDGGSYCEMFIAITREQFFSLHSLCARESWRHGCSVDH